jgi:hypothetical protein
VHPIVNECFKEILLFFLHYSARAMMMHKTANIKIAQEEMIQSMAKRPKIPAARAPAAALPVAAAPVN